MHQGADATLDDGRSDMRPASLLVATLLTAGILAMAACSRSNTKDQYNVFNPTPADKMRSFSTDQPPSTGRPD